jgi:hypothetical protein
MPRVSDIDDACGISTHHLFLSNCVVQVMRVWSLAAVLSLLAKLHIRYGVTQPTAYRISNGVCGVRGISGLQNYVKYSHLRVCRLLLAFRFVL